jgi:hypothetical protein
MPSALFSVFFILPRKFAFTGSGTWCGLGRQGDQLGGVSVSETTATSGRWADSELSIWRSYRPALSGHATLCVPTSRRQTTELLAVIN